MPDDAQEMRGDRSDVVILGSAINLLSITAAFGAVVAVTAVSSGWVAWLIGPLLYLLVVGLAMAFGRRAERAREER